jgi:acetoin utilization deacetylase AcuC-like enzyme
MVAIADQCCGGNLMMLLEGGYSLEALRDGVDAVLRRMREPAPFTGGNAELTSWGAATREALHPYWKI